MCLRGGGGVGAATGKRKKTHQGCQGSISEENSLSGNKLPELMSLVEAPGNSADEKILQRFPLGSEVQSESRFIKSLSLFNEGD